MTRDTIIGCVFAALLGVLALAAGIWTLGERDAGTAAEISPAMTPPTSDAAYAADAQGLIYGRVTTTDGAVYEGRLRFGGDEEALWGNYFNGFKDDNPWLADAPLERLPKQRFSIGAFGIEIAGWERPVDMGRPFMARFGDIVRIEASGRDLRVTLKSGTVFDLDRFAADDFADGVRVSEGREGIVDLDELYVRTIEFLSATGLGADSGLLHGTVHTRHGDFTGFVQWDREACLGSDELEGHTADGELRLRFAAIRSIARRSSDSSLVTLVDGHEIELSGTRDAGAGNRGMYVDDQRYGRVLISWDAFEHVDFTPGGPGPTYDNFPAGRPLTGSVITRSGRRLSGRLVYDLDESETTETLDASSEGVYYNIPFGLIASIVPAGREEGGAQRARVTFHRGEELHFERTGDLGEGNAGTLIFAGDRQPPEYVPWTDVAQIDFAP
jgi:hypothetical protein